LVAHTNNSPAALIRRQDFLLTTVQSVHAEDRV